ncbi:MAG: 2-phosphosulfolactate phosphatase [Melioribacter sp.]|uniref:2-phosphosulfolactate phosphatase n=1 Tax=Rosettibacter primus TaxID=3111523 RepID=UPI00247DCA3B|nr:2-phosphosulfolactate phosphatase [Melioribacter sp.]
MKINVLFSNIFLDELYFTGKTAVMIDVLRASSVITTALSNGAREVIPVSTLDFAMKISSDAFKSQTLLCGERNTKMVEGFNLGNSPLEYKPEIVAGKSIILYTTNGSKSIVKAKFCENLFIGCFLNLPALAKHLINLNLDFEIICAGTNGLFNLEDAVCAGMLINEIYSQNKDIQLSDSAVASLTLNKQMGKNLYEFLSSTEHGKLLIENGFLDDIIECSKYGITDVIPYFVSGSIKRL